MPAHEILDKEFGKIEIRRVKNRSSMVLKITPANAIRITMPSYTPIFMAKRLVATSRADIRELLAAHAAPLYFDGMEIGKSHILQISYGDAIKVTRTERIVHAVLPRSLEPDDTKFQALIRSEVIKVLRREASAHLPRRLAFQAKQGGFSYASVRFSHASSRWGSCSSRGTISLNIALMKLPFELIDYVLLHELCHTKHMNHSKDFWNLLHEHDPEYRIHRSELKTYSPSI